MDKADSWFHNWIKSGNRHEWEDFKRDLCIKFGEEGLADIVEEMMKMTQGGIAEEYKSKFEDIWVRIERFMTNFEESLLSIKFHKGFKG